MTLKLLATGVAAAAIVGGVAAGVTSVAFSSPVAAPAVQPVVFGAPLPQAPAPELQSQLVDTLNALGDGGPFGTKTVYVQGLGPIKSVGAQRAYDGYVSKGYFPITFQVGSVDQEGSTATANVTATAANGVVASRPVTFVQGPSPSGWQLSLSSLQSLLASVG